MKVLFFLMHGRFAHFCAPYTNVYRLTQPCPTKTAIMGFIGSVLGIEKDDLILYQEIQCGLEICSEYRTVSMPYLTRQGFPGSAANKESSRTSVEVIVNPKYRIYITGNSELLLKIHDLMIQQKPVFTPYLGLAQFIASTDFQISELVEGELTEGVDLAAKGAFMREVHGELDFEKINTLSKECKLRITEFEGLCDIKPPRDFEHAVFTVNLDGGTVPLINTKDILKIPAWNKNVPIF
ncbi:MAG: CRISPR-associated protein Cas5 [Candidatus Scalinduaceae bacterium]